MTNKDQNGRKITDEDKIIKTWQEHFKEVRNYVMNETEEHTIDK